MAKKVAEKKVVAKKADKKVVAKKADKKVVKKAMTKGEMIASLSDKSASKLNKKQVQEVYEDLVALAAAQVKACGEFVMPGIGKFSVVERAARTGRNPITKEEIKIAAKKVVKMKISKTFNDIVVSK